ncbi:MAG: 50S ribosomal protein L21 [Candidatus Giovannonibacteria bacterium GW2011_GWB1_45_9b]|uniref:Large ribosomal subunit protein bL21 n=4 Tax=Candidatus Giovannoniibacteriota TaxID=1752738 RepID=A0A1F5WZP7_9BACT|nr:MAG: 50S ribosomal protein L21 [Candidatus Giovannonibacteria bacterium GW2011_GWB1_45_9b]OGF81110.1 MAG: 50S ribosomal protein L21 [Candidatus Giovannonibacteria bacterium RIFCSPHIGHO2_12_44_12]OGF84070.1 MAG: 50S ribosomal protein L21 [Candidatus Giovannonibacteria bacterium RIFCSPLOWO2_02_44_8]
MSKFAVIKTGGKQYLVREGEKLRVEKLPLDNSALIAFNEVLAVGDENGIEAGAPILSNFKVEAERIGEGRFKKVIVARYHSKTRYRKTKGHKQHFTEILIKEIK